MPSSNMHEERPEKQRLVACSASGIPKASDLAGTGVFGGVDVAGGMNAFYGVNALNNGIREAAD